MINIVSCHTEDSEEDAPLIEHFKKHLKILKENSASTNPISLFFKSDISPGANKEETIRTKINAAHIILLLISPDLIGSGTYKNEIAMALERHAQNKSRVIPILMRPMKVSSSFSKLMCLPYERPQFITEWKNRDAAFNHIVNKLSDVIREIQAAIDEGKFILRYKLQGHPSYVYGVAIDLYGQALMSGSWVNSSDKPTVKAWNISTGEELGHYKGETESISCMAAIAQSGIIYYGTNVGKVKVLDSSNPKDMYILYDNIAHDRFVSSLAISIQGDLLVSGSHDGKVKLWKIVRKNLSFLHSFEEHQGKVQSVAISADGRWIVSGGDDSTIKLWDTDKKEVKQSFLGHKRLRGGQGVKSVAISANGQTIVSGGYDAKINLWKVGQSEPEWTTKEEHSSHVNCLVISTDGRFLISGSRDQTVKIWDLHARTLLQTLPHAGDVSCLALSEDGKILISASREEHDNIRIWERM